MVDFAGWTMPVQYSSIIAEHTATRTAATLFDVSHMGRFRFTGPGAQSFLDGLVTRRVTDMQSGQVRYALVTNDGGGVLDDVLVYYLPHAEGGTYCGMVVNASNREKIARWIDDHLGNRGDVRFTDVTTATAMIAVQGPKALDLLQPHIPTNLASMKYYHADELMVQEKITVVSRTGYTGEDGFELIVPASIATDLWEHILGNQESIGVLPAGLGARDTLRLEAGMPLYGHELTEEITPLEADLGVAVNLEDRNFPGAEALRAINSEGPKRIRIGLELSGKRAAREHYGIFAGDQPLGEITSGTFSPTLQKPIAMGYVPPQQSQPGTELSVDIRGSREPARVVKLPFYKRPT
jgi:glycine cleavage system T protein (aminomethyltransferase)